MTVQLSSNQVWEEVEQNAFGVVGRVTSSDEPRTVGTVIVVDDRKLYRCAASTAWKVVTDLTNTNRSAENVALEPEAM